MLDCIMYEFVVCVCGCGCGCVGAGVGVYTNCIDMSVLMHVCNQASVYP